MFQISPKLSGTDIDTGRDSRAAELEHYVKYHHVQETKFDDLRTTYVDSLLCSPALPHQLDLLSV